MGLFDVYELRQHVQAIGEYLLYMDAHPSEFGSCQLYIRDHLKNIMNLLDKLENSS